MDYSVDGFSSFCETLRLENGKTFVLEPFQRVMLDDYFGGATELVIVIPKKNGKTTLLGALALFHLAMAEEPECVIGASSQDQARILFKQAAGLVRRSGLEDTFDVKSGYGEVRLTAHKRHGPRIRVLAADANTADGVIPTLALVDELHRHPSGDLYGVFRDGLGPRDGQMITISTAGAFLNSPLGLLREKAHEFKSFRRDHEAKHNYVRSQDGAFVFHEWCLSPEEDVDDLELVALANPASWQTVKALGVRHASPSTTPWQWRRFACGIWTEGEEAWIEPGMWDRLAEPGLGIGADDDVVLAVDLGVRHDSTAIVAVADQAGRLAVKARILRPPPGGALPLELVEREIRELCEQYTVRCVAYDPWSFRRSAELLEASGLTMVEFAQSAEKMAAASANLYRLIENQELVHDGDQVLRSHVMAGIVKETERGWRLQKDPKRRPIDALIALSMAALVAVGPETEAPMFVSMA